MTTTRLLLAAGFTVAAALSLSGTREPPPAAEHPRPPTEDVIAIALSDALVTEAAPIVADAAPPPLPPRWPDDWPSLDPVPRYRTSTTQTMASGEIDVYLDGNSTFPISDDPAEGAPPEDGDDVDDLSATDEELERLGDMFHAARYGEEDSEEGEEGEEGRPVSIMDEFEDRPDIAEARKRREEARERAQAEEAEDLNQSLEDLDLTDEERAAREEQRKRDEEAYRDLIAEVDAEIEQGGGLFRTPPAFSEPESAEETALDPPTPPDASAAPPSAPPATGYRLTTPDGKPADRVVVGQSVNLELRVTPEDASIPGRAGGRRELDFIEVTLISEDGNEQTIRLWRQDEPSEDGLIRFVSRGPISIAARVNGNPQSGTIEDLDLDLRGPDDQLIETIRIRSRQNVTGGFTTFELFGKPVTAALDEVKDAIDMAEEYLQNERRVAEHLMEGAQDEDVVRDLSEWLQRIDDQLRVLSTARRLAENEHNEEYKLVLSSRLLEEVIVEGPNGWEIRDSNPLRRGTGSIQTTEDILRMERKKLDEKYKGRAMVQRAAFDVIIPFALTSYSQFAHITLGAPAFTLASGLDEFGNEASRGWALVEIGVGVGIAFIAVKLPASVHSYLDEGRLIPPKDLEFVTSPTRPSRPGQLAERTRAGRDRGAVYQDAPYRRLPGETGTPTPKAPGGGRGGLSAEDALHWRQRENPRTQRNLQETNELLSRMDENIRIARDRGVPDDVIDGILADARHVDPETGPVHSSLESAQGFVSSRLEWEIAVRNRDRILISESSKQELDFYANVPEASATPQHLAHAEVVDMVRVESVISKARLEANGEPQGWTPGEIRYGRTLERRLEAGEDLSRTKTITDPGEDPYGPGLRPVFTPDDLVNIRTTFDGRPLKIVPETSARPRNRPGQNRPPPEPDPSEAPTVSPDAPTQRIEGRDPTERIAPRDQPGPSEAPTVSPDAPTQRIEGRAPTERIAPRDQPDPSEAPTVSPDAPTQRIEGRDPTERITPVSRVVNPVTDPTQLGGPSGPGGPRSPIEVVFRGLGGSQGAVMEAFFVNWGADAVHISSEAVTFEPVDELDPDAQARYDELMDAFSSGKQAPPPPLVVGLHAERGGPTARPIARSGPPPLPREWRGANVVRVVLDAYCLEFAAGVPTEGTIFRIADREEQQANARFRAIIAASRHLRDAGALHPDTDPDAYFHSIRQWAIWVEELDLDREGFEEKIVEHTRKNFEAAGQRWTSEAERLVRSLVPNRWRDITAILARADRLERAA